MISKNEYDLLKIIDKEHSVDELQYHDILDRLVRDKLISRICDCVFYPNKYFITQQGQRAIEEHEAHQAKEQRETDSLEIAREANDIAKKANRKSTRANRIASCTALFTLGTLIVAIIALCLQCS